MKISTAIALLVTSVALTACATSNVADDAEVMKPAMKETAMKETTMKKDASCHDHSTNSKTKSATHCHASSQANHSHKYGG